MTSRLGPMIPGKNITFQGEEFGGNQDIYREYHKNETRKGQTQSRRGISPRLTPCSLFINTLSIYRLLSSIMRISSAALSLARGHVTRAAIGGRPSLPLLLARSKGASVGARRFVGMVGRNKSTMTIGNAPSGGSGRTSIEPNVLFAAGTLLIGLFGHYFALKSDSHRELDGVESKIEEVKTMLNSKLDAQDRKLDAQDRKLDGKDCKVDGIVEKVDVLLLKFELKKYWSWFGRSASSVESEDQNMNDIVSKLTKKLDAKVADSLEAVLKDLKGKIGDQDRVDDDNSSKK
jgi:hypothetical protein